MGVHVSPENLAREWSLSFQDLEFVSAKPASVRLGFAVQLKFLCVHGISAGSAAEISEDAVSWLAEQLGVDGAVLSGYDFSGRSGRRHCPEILQHLGFGACDGPIARR